MALWLVRGDSHGSFQNLALEKGFAYHASKIGDLSGVTSREDILALLRVTYPNEKENSLKNWANQLYALAYRIAPGDLVVMPLRYTPQIAIGRASGRYKYRTDLPDIFHTVPVEWLVVNLPRTKIGQDLLYSLGAFMTVCQVKRNNAEARFESIVKDGKDPGFSAEKPPDEENGGSEEGDANGVDIEQLAQDQIMRRIESNFTGHDLARLVEAVLRAEDYVTQFSPPGPDGGVDILAGQGSFGFRAPRLCVQVKSSQSPADVNILRSLQGTMQSFKADQGLLVSWGGFNKAVEKEARLSFFSVRLWDAADLIGAVLQNYERLPEELQSELPLKRIWALVSEQE